MQRESGQDRQFGFRPVLTALCLYLFCSCGALQSSVSWEQLSSLLAKYSPDHFFLMCQPQPKRRRPQPPVVKLLLLRRRLERQCRGTLLERGEKATRAERLQSCLSCTALRRGRHERVQVSIEGDKYGVCPRAKVSAHVERGLHFCPPCVNMSSLWGGLVHTLCLVTSTCFLEGLEQFPVLGNVSSVCLCRPSGRGTGGNSVGPLAQPTPMVHI